MNGYKYTEIQTHSQMHADTCRYPDTLKQRYKRAKLRKDTYWTTDAHTHTHTQATHRHRHKNRQIMIPIYFTCPPPPSKAFRDR